MATLVFSVSSVGATGGNSAATITGSFNDSCRDFAAQSTKNISHVEIHYTGGRVIKHESPTRPEFSIDGGAGDEIGFASVKSGPTTETFTCAQTNSPPTAVLEILIAPDCVMVATDAWNCPDTLTPRTIWVAASNVGMQCKSFGQFGCDYTFRFRGTSSTDPDNDITSWAIDFGGLASTGGTWVTDPPANVLSPESGEGFLVTLTVTDSAGQSHSDSVGAGIYTND
jgi:hypothetical protein